MVGLSSAAAESSTSPKRSQEVNNADSCNGRPVTESVSPQKGAEEHPLLLQPPTEWFGPLATELPTLQPQKLGQVPSTPVKVPRLIKVNSIVHIGWQVLCACRVS